MELARRYRPRNLDEMLGQEHLVGKEGVIRKLLKRSEMPHAFFYGPPGTGKTTLARIIAYELDRPFFEYNATTLKIDALRKTFESHKNALLKPLVFIDEVHRLSKNQQEVLLPYMEDEAGIVIGASTQNPYYALTAAMRSRAMLFELKALDEATMQRLLDRVVTAEKLALQPDSRCYLINSSGGDGRAMLNLLEYAAAIESPITYETLKKLRPQAMYQGSAEADSHYDLTSAMIKSIRGSDIDAALYYLARLIEGGEPPEFIARRLSILASEDIGNANPNALNLSASTLAIVTHIGYPEARIPLAQLVIYLASSPKSNSAYRAINTAQKAIRAGKILPVPDHLKTRSKTYLYPHDFGGWVKQTYLQKPLSFYEKNDIGFEKTLGEWHEKITSENKNT